MKLIKTTLLVLFSIQIFLFQPSHAMKNMIVAESDKKLKELKLKKLADGSLETILEVGDDHFLKARIDSKSLQYNSNQEMLENFTMEVPVILFLTDLSMNPTSHENVVLKMNLDMHLDKPRCVLPEKPLSFDHYEHFKNWLAQAYFERQVKFTYDFSIDLRKDSKRFVSFFQNIPSSYRLIGTHSIEGLKMGCTTCQPNVSYVSQRENKNETSITLSGQVSWKNEIYSISEHTEVFPHEVVSEVVFKEDFSKKFYSSQWIAQSLATKKMAYREFSESEESLWPSVPSSSYSILHQSPHHLEEIHHIGCWDGVTGAHLEIPADRQLMVESDPISVKENDLWELIVKDPSENRLYTVQYQYSKDVLLKKEKRLQEKNRALVLQKESEEKRILGTYLSNEINMLIDQCTAYQEETEGFWNKYKSKHGHMFSNNKEKIEEDQPLGNSSASFIESKKANHLKELIWKFALSGNDEKLLYIPRWGGDICWSHLKPCVLEVTEGTSFFFSRLEGLRLLQMTLGMKLKEYENISGHKHSRAKELDNIL